MNQPKKIQPAFGETDAAGVTVTVEAIPKYIDALTEKGRCTDTAKRYTSRLAAFYSYLLENKRVTAETLSEWCGVLLSQGYSPSTVNA